MLVPAKAPGVCMRYGLQARSSDLVGHRREDYEGSGRGCRGVKVCLGMPTGRGFRKDRIGMTRSTEGRFEAAAGAAGAAGAAAAGAAAGVHGKQVDGRVATKGTLWCLVGQSSQR